MTCDTFTGLAFSALPSTKNKVPQDLFTGEVFKKYEKRSYLAVLRVHLYTWINKRSKISNFALSVLADLTILFNLNPTVFSNLNWTLTFFNFDSYPFELAFAPNLAMPFEIYKHDYIASIWTNNILIFIKQYCTRRCWNLSCHIRSEVYQYQKTSFRN